MSLGWGHQYFKVGKAFASENVESVSSLSVSRGRHSSQKELVELSLEVLKAASTGAVYPRACLSISAPSNALRTLQ